MEDKFDAIIIGSGQAGTPLARELANAGWKTMLIESTHIGGTCINEGCTPSKTMIASGRVAHIISRANAYGVSVKVETIRMAQLVKRKDDLVNLFRDSSEKRLKSTKNLTLVFGLARFVSAYEIEITLANGRTRRIAGEYIFIDTGGRPAMAEFEGADKIKVLNSTSIMDLRVVPRHLVIVGAGYVGLEFGQLFAHLGAKVTLLEPGPAFLKHEDRDVADEVKKVLEKEGLKFKLNTKITSASKAGTNIKLKLHSNERAALISCSHVLLATGRLPNTNTLRLDLAGVALDDRGYIKVNDRLETNVRNIYALGDVKGGPAFTHIGYDDYRLVRDNLLHHGNRTIAGRPLPYVVFIDPELGRIGLTETEAKSKGLTYRVATLPMNHVARALEIGETEGLMKVLVDDNDLIIGAAIFGVEGGEMMSMLSIAMMGKVPVKAMKDAIFAHPTLAESFNNLFARL